MNVYIREIDKSKNHFVAWSGGCDSSLLLYKLCEQLGTSNDNNIITALISEPWFITKNKEISESISRDKFNDMLTSKNYRIGMRTIKTNVTNNGNVYDDNNRGYAQAGLWILQFLPLIPDNSIIHFGYIKGDDFWLYDHNFRSMIDNFCKMLNKKITVEFDLVSYTKSDIISDLIDLNLLDKTWFCEMPDHVGEPCGNCHPCQTYKMALLSRSIINLDDMSLLTEAIEIIEKRKEEQRHTEMCVDCSDTDGDYTINQIGTTVKEFNDENVDIH